MSNHKWVENQVAILSDKIINILKKDDPKTMLQLLGDKNNKPFATCIANICKQITIKQSNVKDDVDVIYPLLFDTLESSKPKYTYKQCVDLFYSNKGVRTNGGNNLTILAKGSTIEYKELDWFKPEHISKLNSSASNIKALLEEFKSGKDKGRRTRVMRIKTGKGHVYIDIGDKFINSHLQKNMIPIPEPRVSFNAPRYTTKLGKNNWFVLFHIWSAIVDGLNSMSGVDKHVKVAQTILRGTFLKNTSGVTKAEIDAFFNTLATHINGGIRKATEALSQIHSGSAGATSTSSTGNKTMDMLTIKLGSYSNCRLASNNTYNKPKTTDFDVDPFGDKGLYTPTESVHTYNDSAAGNLYGLDSVVCDPKFSDFVLDTSRYGVTNKTKEDLIIEVETICQFLWKKGTTITDKDKILKNIKGGDGTAKAKEENSKGDQDLGVDENKAELERNVQENVDDILGRRTQPDFVSGRPSDEYQESPNHPYFNDTNYMHLDAYSEMSQNMAYRHIFSPYATYGIAGMPASFLPTTDPPHWDGRVAGLGTIYSTNYMKYGQFVAFRPCAMEFSSNILKDMFNLTELADVTTWGQKLIAQVSANAISTIKPRLTEYWFQVSRMCRLAIWMMGIQEDVLEFETGPANLSSVESEYKQKRGVKFDGMNRIAFKNMHGDVWSSIGVCLSNVIGNKSHAVSGNFLKGMGVPNEGKSSDGTQKGVPDYDPDTTTYNQDTFDRSIVTFMTNGPITYSESMSNELGPSKISELFSNMTGGTGGSGDIFKEVMSKLGSTTGGGVANLTSLLTGNYMIPNIWTGSSATRSYSCEFKFSSNSGDPVSVFLNTVFPLIKLYALCLPESTGGLLFTPWVVNVYSAGVINIDYGMITELSVRKGNITKNDYGQPTEIVAEITITDMKPYFFQEKPRFWDEASKQSGAVSTVLATLVGHNVTTVSYEQKDAMRRELARINYAESMSYTAKNTQIAINRFLSVIPIWLNRTSRLVKDKVQSAKIYVRGNFFEDSFNAEVNENLNNNWYGMR